MAIVSSSNLIPQVWNEENGECLSSWVACELCEQCKRFEIPVAAFKSDVLPLNRLGVLVVKEFLKMRGLFKTTVAAALPLILGAGVLYGHAASIDVTAENYSGVVADWNVSPSIASPQTQAISRNCAAFESASPLSITFQQLCAVAIASIGTSESPDNSNQTVDAGIIDPVAPTATVKYSGTQLNEVISTLTAATIDSAPAIASDSTSEKITPDATTTPFGQTLEVSEVGTPLASWTSLGGILFVAALYTLSRQGKTASIAS
jgi:hypothetical protein